MRAKNKNNYEQVKNRENEDDEEQKTKTGMQQFREVCCLVEVAYLWWKATQPF